MPADTVRGWLRRARAQAQTLWHIGVRTVVALDPDTLPTARRASPLAYAIDALTAAVLAVRRHGGRPDAAVSTLIAVITRGRLLAPIAPG